MSDKDLGVGNKTELFIESYNERVEKKQKEV